MHLFAIYGVGVGECLEIVRLIDGISDSACHFEALREEILLGLFDGFVGHNQQVAVRLELDFVHFQLL